MTADYEQIVAQHPVWLLCLDEQPAGVLVLMKETDHLLEQQMPDGGWNCQSYDGATHSSFHTTISVLEGLAEYEQRQPSAPVVESQQRGVNFCWPIACFVRTVPARSLIPE